MGEATDERGYRWRDSAIHCGCQSRKVSGCPSRVTHGRCVGARQWAAAPQCVGGSLMASRVKLSTCRKIQPSLTPSCFFKKSQNSHEQRIYNLASSMISPRMHAEHAQLSKDQHNGQSSARTTRSSRGLRMGRCRLEWSLRPAGPCAGRKDRPGIRECIQRTKWSDCCSSCAESTTGHAIKLPDLRRFFPALQRPQEGTAILQSRRHRAD